MGEPRTIVWWSSGAASAVTAALVLQDEPGAILARCETNNEDPDNYRFEADVMRRLNRSVTLLRSDKYDSVPDVWHGVRYMAGNEGAPCTREMKIIPRLAFQLPNDIHIFGYTADARDIERFDALRDNFPEITARAPLIERGVTKAATLAIVEGWNIELPPLIRDGVPECELPPHRMRQGEQP